MEVVFIFSDSMFDANYNLCAKLNELELLDYDYKQPNKKHLSHSDSVTNEHGQSVWGKQSDYGCDWQSAIFGNLKILFNIYPEMQQQYIEQHLKHIKNHE